MCYLYRHIRLDKNEPFYIGIGSDDEYKRANSKYRSNKHWLNIANKTEYLVEIMLDDLTWEEACEKEKEFIALYGRNDVNNGPLVNKTDGGEGSYGLIMNDDSRKKISNKKKGKKLSDVHRENIRIGQIGRTVSNQTREKISGKNKGKKRSEEQINNIKIGIKNSKKIRKKVTKRKGHSQETIQKIIKALKNRSEETRKKISEGNKKWIRTPEIREKMSKNRKRNT